MRIWEGKGGLMTDEQLLRLLAHYGSLDAARAAGDVRLVSAGSERGASQVARTHRGRSLRDYLEDEDEH